MKRLFIILFAIGLTAMSSTAMAAMSNSKVRNETRFLTDKMAYELNMSTAQYNDAYEINFDFISSIRNLMDEVVRGEAWALDEYYELLDVRNDDLRYVLSDTQYRRFLRTEYFYRPIYANAGRWNFRIYITYTNHNHFYFGRPYHYRSYVGGHCRARYHNVSYYRGRHNHNYYTGAHSVRDDRVYRTNRRSDFGSVNIRPNSSARPNTGTSSRRRESTSSTNRESNSVRRSGSDSGSSRTNGSSSRSSSESSGRRNSNSSRDKSSDKGNSSSSSSSSRSSDRSSGSGSSRR